MPMIDRSTAVLEPRVLLIWSQIGNALTGLKIVLASKDR